MQQDELSVLLQASILALDADGCGTFIRYIAIVAVADSSASLSDPLEPHSTSSSRGEDTRVIAFSPRKSIRHSELTKIRSAGRRQVERMRERPGQTAM